MVMNSKLCHPTVFVGLKWNCCGYEQHTVSLYSFCSFKVKLLWLWTAHSVTLYILHCDTLLQMTLWRYSFTECASGNWLLKQIGWKKTYVLVNSIMLETSVKKDITFNINSAPFTGSLTIFCAFLHKYIVID